MLGAIEDNPTLDVDDTDGFGPENITIPMLVPGLYRVAVHGFDGAGDATVRVVLGEGTTDEVSRVFGPLPVAHAAFVNVTLLDLPAGTFTAPKVARAIPALVRAKAAR